ncbi:cobalt transporter CbiM [Fonticella tunisiensis]|uniref:Cobalt/nickel transport system permease protein n=1 Tax=Fonticella tunisiensis TaxID=1096341 RepID=A0A4R7KT63_9CLOT|nr:cobalt transporter CbiM [Fonticella tunisiensis]TDT62329.1 cobalt/nickel transport system permease protein [Fonticella tunisiensis]
MHIPENYLSPSTCAVLGAAMVPVWKRASANVKREFSKKKMPLLGVGAAFSFLIMMFNLPLPGGTTGHAVGAALISILLGPYAASISVTIALAVQALFFGDGGILALGANAFNLAFIMPFTAHYIYKIMMGRGGNRRNYIAAFLAGYVSLNAAALFTAVELGIQPVLFKDASGMPLYNPYGLSISVPAMMIPHLLVAGVVEGIVTAGVYGYIRKVSGEGLNEGRGLKIRPLYVALIVMIILSPLGLLASGTAWGEWGADEIKSIVGFVPQGMEKGFNFKSSLPDYTVPGFSEHMGYILSGIIGVLIIVFLFMAISAALFIKREVKITDK